MFLRGIEGIYVTLKPLDKLFINKMDVYKENPYDDNDIGYKVYEIPKNKSAEILFSLAYFFRFLTLFFAPS